MSVDLEALLNSPGSDLFADDRTPRLRLRVPATSTSIKVDPNRGRSNDSGATFWAKEWSITDDVLNVSDAASVSIANDDGEHSGKFKVGQRIEIDEQDPGAAEGRWVRHFTGRITAIESYSDLAGGSNILLSAMDLGWHLTSCHAKPLVNIKNIRFQKLLDLLIDSSWGFAPTNTERGNDLNRRLKHGRQVIVQNHKPVLGGILPFIQVEPGQAPFEILRTYAAREGVLINVGARGELIFFRPAYNTQASQSVHYHSSKEDARKKNNIVGRPTLRETIDGLYSEVQCWSTVVIPPEIVNSENPNEMYRHSTYKPSTNPLPFSRRHVFSDGEAINQRLRGNRALWKSQIDEFNSWQYECEFPAHSQNGGYFVSDTMITMNDSIHKISGAHYVQAVRRSLTLKDGLRSRLTIRKPGLLNPELTALDLGGGARKAASK